MPARRFEPLDGIRGLAVFFVVVHHWTLVDVDEALGFDLNMGNLGIQLFFALSGFLITGILMDFRDRRERGEIDLRTILTRFWQSRTARLLPVVMLTLLVVGLAGDRLEKREYLVWHATFTSNILFFLRGEFVSNLAHFWSLAVEQQFYLIWPFVILLARRRSIEPLLATLVVLAPLVRFTLYQAGFTSFAQYNVLPMANFDSLGAGSLLALWLHRERDWDDVRLRALSALAVVACVAFIANRLYGRFAWNPEQSFGAILSAWLISSVVRHPRSLMGRAFSWRPLVALGVVSYGVYAYHVFAPRAVGFVLRRLDMPASLQSGWPLLLFSALATIAVAMGSWYLMEKPVNDFRRRWQERAAGKAGRSLPSAVPPTIQRNGSQALE